MGVRNWLNKAPDREQWRTKDCNARMMMMMMMMMIIIIIIIIIII
jgi:hypothetical protein